MENGAVFRSGSPAPLGPTPGVTAPWLCPILARIAAAVKPLRHIPHPYGLPDAAAIRPRQDRPSYGP